jgi:hypothetical protein
MRSSVRRGDGAACYRQYSRDVLVHVGPVESQSVLVWTSYSRAVLHSTLASRESKMTLDASLLEGFEALLDQWEQTARAGDQFVWSTDAEPEQLEYLAHAFFNIVSSIARESEARGERVSPAEGDAFYYALVHGLLAALFDAGGSHAEFAEFLRASWPGLQESE